MVFYYKLIDFIKCHYSKESYPLIYTILIKNNSYIYLTDFEIKF
ncbi:hypothetical protein SAMN05443543_1085 [Flavobacterium flevense]|nr:hypothetical protein SAMN05443543_1085 [Flavobacterium flevense]